MKKRLALLLGVFLVLTAVFAACSQPAATARHTRWSETGEKYTFKITMSDFATEGSSLFKSYTRNFNLKGDNDQVTDTAVTCYKDDVITSTEGIWMSGWDQLRPVDADGTYTVDVKYEATSITVETKQTLYSQYKTEDLTKLDCLQTVSKCDVTAKEENPFTNNEGRTTLRSVTETSVVFANDAKQLPISSVTENHGYYIGQIAQSLSDYKYETTYDFANKKVSVKKDGGEAEERAIKGECIDANQLLTYVRSLDKSSAAFQDSPSVAVYDVTTNNVSTASFALKREFNLLFDNNGQEAVVSVNAVTVAVGGMPFMAQYNLPDLTKLGDGFDYLPLSADRRCKYTTVKFRSGWYSYELQPDEYYQHAIDEARIKSVA